MGLRKKIFSIAASLVMAGSALSGAYIDPICASAAAKQNVFASGLRTAKVDSKNIRLTWNDKADPYVTAYHVDRYDTYANKWINNYYQVKSDRKAGSNTYTMTDRLTSAAPRQYYYRIRVDVANANAYAPETNGVWGSNIKICIDPGHFLKNNGGTYGYYESEANFIMARALAVYLKSEGIDYYMTRNNANITLGGYTNLDNSPQLEARGHAAKYNNCDYFLSIHTNANNADANGRDTIHQLSALNKTIVFVNSTIYNKRHTTGLRIANNLGQYVTNANKRLKITTNNWNPISRYGNNAYHFYTSAWFPTVYNDMFTRYNDEIYHFGYVVYRQASLGDYYAVLRAAAQDSIPGILIEHSYHTVPEFCKRFMGNPTVAKAYALADARAIAHGLGFAGASSNSISGYTAPN